VQQANKDKQHIMDAPEKADRQWFRSVGLRVITALIGIPIVLAVVWLGGWWAFAASALIALLAVYELHAMMLHEGYHPVILVSSALSLLFMVAAMLPQQRLPLLEVGISLALLISFPVLFFRKKLDGAMIDWSLTMAIAIYLGWPMSLLLILRGYQVGLGTGVWWLLALFCGVWGFDTGAFFAGHFFGRHKLAPRISPGKTWEGVFGGLIFSIAAALLFTTLPTLFHWPAPLGVPWYLAVVLGLLVGVAAVLGDLAESLIKRQTHVKDSGQFFPGHGGALDRIDSLLFAVLVIFIFAQLIGKV
jgi:phosphatidate cytidylyltransferase